MVSLCPVIVALFIVLAYFVAERGNGFSPKYKRADFPLLPKFVFGAGTSAYQAEGGANEDGRTPSISDTFSPHTGKPFENGDIACDQYHKYKGDVQLMVDTGLEAYRFSISWSRLIPNGRGPVNPKGLLYYNNLINELKKHGIQPHVTLVQYDSPQALEDEYGGWASRDIVKDFEAYADVCFREFGDRVLHWTTVNEANMFMLGGYDTGELPPKHCSSPFGFNCTRGNSSSEPYNAAHNCLLAHAAAAHLYKTKYHNKQHGFIGLIEPLVFGDYPAVLKKNAGTRIPSFSPQESNRLKNSFDFIGLNHYVTGYVKDDPDSLNSTPRDAMKDMGLKVIMKRDSASEFPASDSSGMQCLLEYFRHKYGNPPIYIYENGQHTPRSSSLNDISRIKYLDAYIGSLLDAVRNGSNTWGYFIWSFVDVYKLIGGYTSSYGLYFVDNNDPDLTRYPKLSAYWYSNFLKGAEHKYIL